MIVYLNRDIRRGDSKSDLTKVQIYKLKKVNPSIPEVLLDGILGIKVNKVGFGCNW